MVVGKRLAGGADGVQGVALGDAAPRWPLGSADLHHPLTMGLQKGRQPGAIAAGTLHRPTAPTGHLRPGEVEQATVAGRAADGRLEPARQESAGLYRIRRTAGHRAFTSRTWGPEAGANSSPAPGHGC